MTLKSKVMGSRSVALIAVFTALVVVLDAIPMIPGFYGGVWDSWVFLFSPLVGVILGPTVGFFSILFGSLIGHLLYFRDVFELVFMVGAALGSGMAGLAYRRKWRPVMGVYTVLLMLYLVYPVSWSLPLFGIWDVLAGYAVVTLFSVMTTRNALPKDRDRRMATLLALAGIIGLESDVLFRVVLLVPGQTYWFFYGLDPSQLVLLWLAAGVITPIKVAMGTVAVVVVGLTLLHSLNSMELGLPS